MKSIATEYMVKVPEGTIRVSLSEDGHTVSQTLNLEMISAENIKEIGEAFLELSRIASEFEKQK